MNGNATMRAAEEVKKQIAAAAAKKMNCAAEGIIFKNDRLERQDSGAGRASPAQAERSCAANARPSPAASKARSSVAPSSKNARTKARKIR